MKTLQIISTAAFMSLASMTFANDNNKELTITIIEVVNPTCNGGNNGHATVLAKGGKAPYTYNWNTFPNQTAAEAINLSAGTYFVEVTDAEGTVFFKPIEIAEPNASVINEVDPQSESLDIKASVSGENAPYSFQLNGDAIDNQNIADLSVGIHKLVITDASSCEMVQYIQIYKIEDAPAVAQDTSTEGMSSLDKAKVMMKSKNDRIYATGLIPTKTIDEFGNTKNLVIVSSR